MKNNNYFKRQNLDGRDGTNLLLRAESPNNQEKFSILKLYVGNYDNAEDGGITVGYWTHNKNCEIFIPTSPSHWNLLSDTFYIKDVRNLPIKIGEEISCECVLETYCFDNKNDKSRLTKSVRELMGLPKLEKPSKYAIGICDDCDDMYETAIKK